MAAQRSMVVTVGANVAPYVAGMGQAGAATGKFAAQTTAARTGATRLGSGLGLLSPKILGPAGIVLGLRAASSAAEDFDESQIRLRTQIGLTVYQSDQLAAAAREVGVAYGAGGQAAIDASWQIASAGLRGAAATETLERSAAAAALGFGDMTTVADLVTSAINAYGADSLSAAQATNILAYAVREGKAAPEELAASMGQVLPIASEMGVEFSELASIVAAMTRTGTNAATANIQMRQVLMNLLKPSQQASEALADVGLSAAGIQRVIREDGLFEALLLLREAFADNEQGMAAVFENARSLMGALDLMGANVEENRRIVEGYSDDIDLLAEGIDDLRESSVRFQRERATAAFRDWLQDVGEMTSTPRMAFWRGVEDLFTIPSEVDNLVTRLAHTTENTAVALGLVEDLARMAGRGTTGAAEGLERFAAAHRDAAVSDAAAEWLGWVAAQQAGRASLEDYPDLIVRLNREIGLNVEAVDEATGALERYTSAARAQSDPLFALMDAQERYSKVSGDVNASAEDQLVAFLNLMGAVDQVSQEGFDGRLDPALRQALVLMGQTEEEIRELEDALWDAYAGAEALGQDWQVNIDTAPAIRSIRALAAEIRRLPGISGELIDEAATSFSAGRRGSGGPVWPGTWLVGEHGPELIQMGGAGHVVAAPQTANMMGGGGGATYNLSMPVTQTTMDEGEVRRALRRAEMMAA